jgi:hypothetical protein
MFKTLPCIPCQEDLHSTYNAMWGGGGNDNYVPICVGTLQNRYCVPCRAASAYLAELPLRTAYLAEQPLRTLQNCRCVPCRAAPAYLAELPMHTLQISETWRVSSGHTTTSGGWPNRHRYTLYSQSTLLPIQDRYLLIANKNLFTTLCTSVWSAWVSSITVLKVHITQAWDSLCNSVEQQS